MTLTLFALAEVSMPRIRTLKPEHRSHRKVGKLSDRAYRLWVGMILEADDAGRLICDPDQLRARVFAYHPKVTATLVIDAMRELESSGLVRLYEVDGVAYASFPSWRDHQRIDHARPSVLPGPPSKGIREASENVREDSRMGGSDNSSESLHSTNPRESSREIQEHSRTFLWDRKGSEGIGKNRKGGEGSSRGTNGEPPPAATEFQIPAEISQALSRARKLGAVPQLRRPAWWQAEIQAHEGMDLARELSRAEAFLVTHPERKYKNYAAFLDNWFKRSEADA